MSEVRNRKVGKRMGTEGTHCPHAQGVAISVEGSEVLAEFLAACRLDQGVMTEIYSKIPHLLLWVC